MDNKPRNHHFIPVFYLKQWASSLTKKVIEQQQTARQRRFETVGPRKTGFQTIFTLSRQLPPEVATHEEVFLPTSDNYAALHTGASSRGQIRVARGNDLGVGSLYHAYAPPSSRLSLIAEMRVAAAAIWQAAGGESQRIYDQEVRKSGDPETFQDYLTGIDRLSPPKSA